MAAEWFSVDRAGLAKQLADVPSWRLIAELLANAWDEKSTQVQVTIGAAAQRGYYTVEVEDDNPDGFKDLTHAWTLFAPSAKGGNAEQRGRFNLGEKLLLAAAKSAVILTTTGSVVFDQHGRHLHKTKTQGGSRVIVTMKLQGGLDFTTANLQRLMAPVPTRLVVSTANRDSVSWLPKADPLKVIEATLPTVAVNEAGDFIRTERKTTVQLHQVTDERPAAVYELGVPVVDTDMPWSIDVQQKVPLNRDRDNVTPGYLQQLRVLAFNAMADQMDQDQFRSDWARAAAGDDDADQDAVNRSLDERFGKNRVSYNPSDQEANRLAMAKGYTVVPGGSMSKGEWSNARTTTLPAGQVTPSPKPFTPGGRQLRLWEGEPTAAMRQVETLIKALGWRCGIGTITVVLADDAGWPFRGAFGPDMIMYLNVHALGLDWFDLDKNLVKVLDLMIHELGHHDGSSHLSEAYYDNLTRIGGQVAVAALDNPGWFRR